MANLYWKPKTWVKYQDSYDALPTSLLDTDSIPALVSFSADVQAEEIKNPAEIIQFMDIVELENIRMKASLKMYLNKEFWEGKAISILKAGAFKNVGTTGKVLALGAPASETYLSLFFGIDGINFAIKNARPTLFKISKSKNSIMEFQFDVEGELVTSGLPTYPNYSISSGTPITNANLQGKTNFWASWELNIKNDYYDQFDHSTGKHKLLLTGTEATMKFDYDAGVFASWTSLVDVGVAVSETILLNGFSTDSLIFNGKLVNPAMIKERDNVASQEIEIKLTSLETHHGA